MDLYELYDELYLLTKKQRDCIKDDDYDKLIKILEEKNEIIEKIAQINLEEYIKNSETPKEKYNKLKDIMEKIKDLEEKNQKKLKNKKENLAFEMKDFSKKQKSRDGYRKQNSYEAKFIDKKS